MCRFFLLCLFFMGVSLSVSISASAHEVRPGYIEINETSLDVFDIAWKQPVRDSVNQVAALGLRPVFPAHCVRLNASTMHRRPGALIEQFSLKCEGGLLGFAVGVEGLQKTITDIFVRLTLSDGKTSTLRLTAQSPIASFQGGGTGLVSYFLLGVEHLLFGFDHILFIIGLVFLVSGWRLLVWTISGFTLAHSVTLALSALGAITLSPLFVEAMIALSLIFIGWELSRPPERRSHLATIYPQSVALGFGLLHGFGFAGVIAAIGLPRDAALAALALFNVGLEVGQLLLIAILVGGLALLRPTPETRTNIIQAACLLIGSLGVYWFLERSFTLFNL
ncbi:MAG: HupE/UreJ family protein [Alphaproteobacteria bacterium]|nr:HupE/UreJ family protein [Alphaproteobacteria bacterium]MBE8220293.1 HupE/UreJ family protein [Alphaproteobacteria bacterium]